MNSEELTRPQLTAVRVEGLLDDYNHSIGFRTDQKALILFGPNGVGKTHLLELISYTLQGEWALLQEMPFKQAFFSYSDDSEVRLSFTDPDSIPYVEKPRGITGRRVKNDQPRLKVSFLSNAGVEEWMPPIVDLNRVSPMIIRRVMNEIGIRPGEAEGMSRYGSSRWSLSDLSTDDAAAIRRHLARAFSDDMSEELAAYPEWADRYFGASYATLIETQRLIASARGSEEATSSKQLAIDQVSRSVQLLMDQALAANSRISQQLDRTFPERVLSSAKKQKYSEGDIRRKHTEQLAIRQRLAQYHLASEDESSVELPDRDLVTWEESFLGLYLEDSEQKLESFKELLDRLDLFTATLNRHFHRKRVFFRDDRSLAIEGSSGRMLSVANLSSGEQHELILTKYLLFDAEPHALVLIDEPEISLHVAWQKAFLDDLQSFSKVSNVRFIIATHSPQIINNSWELTQALGEAE